MNLEALDYIVNNEPDLIRGSAVISKVNSNAAEGIAKKVVAEGGDEDLSPAQKHVFDRAVRPLIENITCAGNWNRYDDDPQCGNPIPESQLYDYYANDETLCESCQSAGDYQSNHLRKVMDE
ncbi:hypothetical protein [Serratia rubidaea]|uniref:hypothetical protein n=1 Tax=Serratia rubidaea TaxID=61652 RepID=UPI003FA34821